MHHTLEKKLILGTAQWGWNVDKQEAFQILDAWMEAGQMEVDAATNYPINRNPDDFRRSEQILLEYIKVHGLSDLRVTMKIGSLDNMRGPEVNLAPSFVQMLGEEYTRLFGANLSCLMFHWDNREEPAAIGASLEALVRFCNTSGLQPGLSGIAHPERYAQALLPMRDYHFNIEVKHNLVQSDFERYKPLWGQGHRFWVYGINAGGLKLDAHYHETSTLARRGGPSEKSAALIAQLNGFLPQWNQSARPPIRNMNEIGLLYAVMNQALHGVIVGVSSATQLRETLTYYRHLQSFDYSDVFEALQHLNH